MRCKCMSAGSESEQPRRLQQAHISSNQAHLGRGAVVAGGVVQPRRHRVTEGAQIAKLLNQADLIVQGVLCVFVVCVCCVCVLRVCAPATASPDHKTPEPGGPVTYVHACVMCVCVCVHANCSKVQHGQRSSMPPLSEQTSEKAAEA